MKLPQVSLVSLFLFAAGCSAQPIDPPGPVDNAPVITYVLDKDTRYQTIRNFGASDAWAIQFVGKNWPEASRSRIAELLFSTELTAEGDPKGIGLSAWRFNIGAGSAEQGAGSQINDEWRRAECFLTADGTYDWSRQAGQLWFVKEAQRLGVQDFVGFVNSPPVHFTRNGKAWSEDGVSANLAEDRYEAYAHFLAEVAQGVLDQTGVSFDYISPFNEPQWEWKCCGQEGSPWNNAELAAATRVIDRVFTEKSVTSKIEITEAGQIDFLYSDTREPKVRNNQIATFFDPASIHYVGDLNHIARKVAAHSYFTTWDTRNLLDTRRKLHQKLTDVDPTLEYWMSEYTLLEDNAEVKGPGRDLGMDPAIYVARVIMADLMVANASAWHWWLSVSPYDYKDGLIYIDLNKQSGNIYESKMLWALGHFSRFIRPGSVRIDVSTADGSTIDQHINGLLASAYLTPSGEMVVVWLNQQRTPKVVGLTGLGSGVQEVQVFQTTAAQDQNLRLSAVLSSADSIAIPARSIVTCVIKQD